MGQFYTDGDYVSDEAEYDHGTNPGDGDTDNDALDDRQEIYYYGTYGYTWDSDEDELSDKKEITEGTDPLRYTYKWLLMMYLDGDNDLFSEVLEEKEDMLSYYDKLTYPVKITMLFDGNGNEDSEYYQIEKDGYTHINMEELNMGDSETLKDFIRRSYNFYRYAERIVLVMSNHGAAALGLCQDAHSNGDMLTIAELKNSLEYASNLFNGKIDILYFQACNMQQIEIGYEIKNYVKNIVGSQWILGGKSFTTFPHRIIINRISKAPEESEEGIAKEIVNEAIYNSDDYVISSIKTDYINEITYLINDISSKLITNWSYVQENILKVVRNPWFYNSHATDYPYRDLKHFFLWVKENLTLSGYSDPIFYRDVESLLSLCSRSVYVNFNDYERAHLWFQGVGIFLPVNTKENNGSFLTAFEHTGASNWYELTQLIVEGFN